MHWMRFILPAALTMSVLSGCQFDAAIDIRHHGASPEFVVRYDGAKAACVEGLTVAAITNGARRKVWAVRKIFGDGDATCAANFLYGRVPAGYETVVAAEPLTRSLSYEVAATGAGWSASTPLTAQ
jgi:hypothetical protein